MTPIILFTYQYKDHTSTKLSTGLGNNRLSYTDANGHALLYVRGEDHKHRVKNDNGIFKETNTKLKENIVRSIQETIINMKNK